MKARSTTEITEARRNRRVSATDVTNRHNEFPFRRVNHREIRGRFSLRDSSLRRETLRESTRQNFSSSTFSFFMS